MKPKGHIPHPKGKIIQDHNELARICRHLSEKHTICLTAGAFDLVHDGHFNYLYEARNLADFLVVGVDSDALVKMIKGESRPAMKQHERSLILSGFEFVDIVTVHDSSLRLVQTVRPHFFVISTTTKVVGAQGREDCRWIERNGGKLVTFGPMSPNHTTDIIKALKSR